MYHGILSSQKPYSKGLCFRADTKSWSFWVHGRNTSFSNFKNLWLEIHSSLYFSALLKYLAVSQSLYYLLGWIIVKWLMCDNGNNRSVFSTLKGWEKIILVLCRLNEWKILELVGTLMTYSKYLLNGQSDCLLLASVARVDLK